MLPRMTSAGQDSESTAAVTHLPVLVAEPRVLICSPRIRVPSRVNLSPVTAAKIRVPAPGGDPAARFSFRAESRNGGSLPVFLDSGRICRSGNTGRGMMGLGIRDF